jgi:arabinogalactan endo-1,4-beta-galactosidase
MVDPAQQETPIQWQGISFRHLNDSIYNYTEKIMTELQPDYVQIGNGINLGFLHPYGHISNNFQQFKELLNMGITAVRANSNNSKIILYFTGLERFEWFFNQVNVLDYDIIGFSYYPKWHGISLNNLKIKMKYLSETYNKKILITETACPFTLEWNDWTNNIAGLDEQFILPEYPATIEGQRKFINQIKILTKEVEDGIGFCYWGAELITWKGNQSTDTSPWENQALFDLDNKALPVLSS